MQERKIYKVELTETQKDRFDKLLEFVGVDYIKLKEIEDESMKEDNFPEIRDIYYYVSGFGEVLYEDFTDDGYDKGALEMGNCFKTKEEAEFELERLKVIAEMKKFAEPKDREWDGRNDHYSIFLIYEITGNSKIQICNRNTYCGNDICFETIEMAQKCIDSVGADRIKKYYLRVESKE